MQMPSKAAIRQAWASISTSKIILTRPGHAMELVAQMQAPDNLLLLPSLLTELAGFGKHHTNEINIAKLAD